MKAKILDLVYWNSRHEERIPVALPFFKKKKKRKENIPICILDFEMVRSWSNSLTPSLWVKKSVDELWVNMDSFVSFYFNFFLAYICPLTSCKI